LSSDPDFRFYTGPDLFRIQGFDDQKLEKKAIFKKDIFDKIAIYLPYLFMGLHKGRPSNRISLQPSKENIQHLKT
jgi:hypothetical protein